MNHREIIELLPWYVNGTLEEDERRTVEAHLKECSPCALEWKQLGTIQAAALEQAAEAPSPSSASLHGVLDRIEEYEGKRSRTPKERIGWLTKLLSAMREPWWQPTPAFARVLMAAQLVLVIALGGMLLFQGDESRRGGTASGPSTTPIQQNVTRIAVGFTEGVSEQTMRDTILAIQGNIVDGPSALGLYTVEVRIPPQRTEEIDKLLQGLLKDRKVVRFAARTL